MSSLIAYDLGFRSCSQSDAILHNISFAINPPDRISLLGPDGAGKLTPLDSHGKTTLRPLRLTTRRSPGNPRSEGDETSRLHPWGKSAPKSKPMWNSRTMQLRLQSCFDTRVRALAARDLPRSIFLFVTSWF